MPFRSLNRKKTKAFSAGPEGLAEPGIRAISIRNESLYCEVKAGFAIERNGRLCYNFCVVDSQKSPTNRHVRQGIESSKLCFAPEATSSLSKPWRNEPAEMRRRGIVFATSRNAGRDEAGTLRAPVLHRGQRVRRRPEFCGRTGR